MPIDKAWCGVNRKTRTSSLERREWSKSCGVINQRLHGASLLKRRKPQRCLQCAKESHGYFTARSSPWCWGYGSVEGGTCLAHTKPGSDLQYSVSGVCL